MARPQKIETPVETPAETPASTSTSTRKTSYKVKKNCEGSVVTIGFHELGENGAEIANVSLDLDALSPEIVRELAIHGAKQKLGDATSGETMVEAAVANVNRVREQLLRGEFRAARESTGGGGGRTSDLATAVHRATGKPLDRCIEVIAGMSDEDKSALRKSPKIQIELRKISLERAQSKAGTAEDALPDLGL